MILFSYEGQQKEIFKKLSHCLWDSWLSLIIRILSTQPSVCYTIQHSEAGSKKEGNFPAWAFCLVDAAICGEGTVTSRCDTISKTAKAQKVAGLSQSPSPQGSAIQNESPCTSPLWPVGFLWGKGALKMNKQNQKKKVGLSEGALSIPQGYLVLRHGLGSGFTFYHFLPLAPLSSTLCCGLC